MMMSSTKKVMMNSIITINYKIISPHEVVVTYDQFENGRNIELIQGILEKYSFLFPTWLMKLRIVVFDQSCEEDSSLEASVQPENWEYGHATIDIMAKFFERTSERQEHIIVHELVHVIHGKAMSFDRKNLLDFVRGTNKDLGIHLTRAHTEINEEVTETLTRIIIANRK